MILTDTTGWALGSHERVDVSCDFSLAEKCRGVWTLEYRHAQRWAADNDGKVICLFCSRRLKSTGRNNPNARYLVPDDLMSVIDSEAKAYLLGWVASDGTISEGNTVKISIHRKDRHILEDLNHALCVEAPIKSAGMHKPQMVNWCLNSLQISRDICRWLTISPGKKSHTVSFPHDIPDQHKWAFVRGLFDGDGSVRTPTLRRKSPSCGIASSSEFMRQSVSQFCDIPCTSSSHGLAWSGTNAIDFLGKLYDGANIFLERKESLYQQWASWVPMLGGPGNSGRNHQIFWAKTRTDAVAPAKARASDSGYDLVALERVEELGLVQLYDTGIKVKPGHGWYMEMVPRSSIIKSGYMLANSVGVIDQNFTGTIKVPLIKVDPNAPELVLPARLVQLVPRPIIHAQLRRVESFDDTSRGGGGFGSSGQGAELAQRVSGGSDATQSYNQKVVEFNRLFSGDQTESLVEFIKRTISAQISKVTK